MRTQHDDRQFALSKAGALDCSASEDMTRQEFKDEADINKILNRFGYDTQQKTPTFGEVNFTADLQQALDAIKQARAAHADLPPDVKKDFPTWQTLLNALERGEIRLKADTDKPIEKVPEEKKD